MSVFFNMFDIIMYQMPDTYTCILDVWSYPWLQVLDLNLVIARQWHKTKTNNNWNWSMHGNFLFV